MMIPKFRVWDKKRAEMLNLIAINFHKQIPTDDLMCSCSDGPITRNFEDVTLMQSTGLFDKNGVEIFEGDILEYANNKKYSPRIRYQVFFQDGAFNWENDITLCSLNLKYKSGFEVIGNIHENPELLEGSR